MMGLGLFITVVGLLFITSIALVISVFTLKLIDDVVDKYIDPRINLIESRIKNRIKGYKTVKYKEV